jgi:hypothetical protein
MKGDFMQTNGIKQSKVFERGKGDWEKLFNFMDENSFSAADFLACVCANLLSYPTLENEYSTELMLQGQLFKIKIETEKF